MDIRERIAKMAYNWAYPGGYFLNTWEQALTNVPSEIQGCYDFADQILSLPGIRVEAENRDLPESPYEVSSPYHDLQIFRARNWKECQQAMLQGDKTGVWVKCRRKEVSNE